MLTHGRINALLFAEPQIRGAVAQILRFGQRTGGSIFGIDQRALSVTECLQRMGVIEIDNILQGTHLRA
ncbi:hypothetical protein D3C81_1868240 [compost metagenome]